MLYQQQKNPYFSRMGGTNDQWLLLKKSNILRYMIANIDSGWKYRRQKSCLRETLNLAMFGDSSTNTKNIVLSHVLCNMLHVTCDIPNVACDIWHLTCHMSPTWTARDPPPANFPTIHSRLVQQDRTKKKDLNLKSQPKLEYFNSIIVS